MTEEKLKKMAKEYERSIGADYLQDEKVLVDYAYKKETLIQTYIDGFEDSVSTVNDILEDNEELKERVSELEAEIEKLKGCRYEILERIDESCIGALNEEVRAIFKKWKLGK